MIAWSKVSWTELSAEPTPSTSGRRVMWRLTKDCTVTIGALHFTIPKGFCFDFASVPLFIGWLLPQTALFSIAALVHDYLYHVGQSKGVADGALLDLLRHTKQGYWVRFVMTASVALFGWPAYLAHRRADKDLVNPKF